MKTLLLYDDIVPMTRQAHGGLSLKKGNSYDFARLTNSVPLVAAEFPQAAGDCAIVFTEAKEGVIPAAVLGLRDNENAYVGADGGWLAPYVPAFVRRYPFVFAADEKGENFTLMLDRAYDGFNTEGRGERLFDAEGAQTAFLDATLAFMKEYQALFAQTCIFGSKLKALGLLEAVDARLPLPQDPQRRLTGFQIVNRDKLKALGADMVAQMLQSDELELVFLHLFSLRNLGRLQERMAAMPAQPAVTKPAAAPKPAKPGRH